MPSAVPSDGSKPLSLSISSTGSHPRAVIHRSMSSEIASERTQLNSKPSADVFHAGAVALGDFLKAVAEGDVDSVEELLEQGMYVDMTDADGNTALLCAAEGEPQIVQALIEAGCNVNHQNAEGCTALIRAIKYEDGAPCLVLEPTDSCCVRLSMMTQPVVAILAALISRRVDWWLDDACYA